MDQVNPLLASNEVEHHLIPYGYAPGNYMNVCIECKTISQMVDKRAYVCRKCAELRFKQDNEGE